VLVFGVHVEILLVTSCLFGVLSHFSIPFLLVVSNLFNDLWQGPYDLSNGEIVFEVEDLNNIVTLGSTRLVNVDACSLLISSQNQFVGNGERSWIA